MIPARSAPAGTRDPAACRPLASHQAPPCGSRVAPNRAQAARSVRCCHHALVWVQGSTNPELRFACFFSADMTTDPTLLHCSLQLTNHCILQTKYVRTTNECVVLQRIHFVLHLNKLYYKVITLYNKWISCTATYSLCTTHEWTVLQNDYFAIQTISLYFKVIALY